MSPEFFKKFKNDSIQEQTSIRDALRIEFNEAKEKLIEAEKELKIRLNLTYEDYLKTVSKSNQN